ncbi:MAG: hypothetical protein CL687_01860 [Candidatus Pelagibacter sp.]|nr:hypothetical protein [Candidatus Pelagibacter sp.]OUW24350.1 MAG: hypothetical protein CBD34_01135 [Rickettsiales bacterium TMED174]|tara:strand:- start:33 stop:533 length:501 start_codon:yes stop_codon:yes gene_type:complete
MKTKIFFVCALTIFFVSKTYAASPVSTGKNKNWESFTFSTDKGKVCFAQSVPIKRSPSSFKRNESRIFVTFRPKENIKDEISITSGHEYKSSSVTARSGKNNFSFFSQKNFAWLLDEREEQKLIKVMKRATDLMVKADSKKGTQSTDHYSMMGFTKAYNTAKKNCN